MGVNPIQQAQAQQIMAAMATLPAGVRQTIAQAAIASQRKVMGLPLYSTVRFQLPAAVANVFTLLPPQPERSAFSYKIGDALGAAQGFDPSIGQATLAETNLLKASETRSNDDVYIAGIAAMWSPESDAQIIQLATRQCAVVVGLNGDDSYTIGRLDFIPGGGGLAGTGVSYLQPPNLAEVWNTRWGQITNGVPGRDNYLRLPNQLVWRGSGTGKDTSLVFTVKQLRSIVVNSAAARVAAAGVAGWAPPAPPNNVGTYADLTFRLISQQVGQRSENA